MKSSFQILIMVFCIFALMRCSGERPPYAHSEALPTAVIFAENVVSSELPEFATSFSPDGNTVYFNLASANRGTLKIMKSDFYDGEWQTPEALPFADGTYRDLDPFVTADGKRLYFSSNRPLEGTEPNSNFDTWYVEKTADGWGEPINPGSPLNSDAFEFFVSAANNGAVYFSSDARGENTNDIYRAALSGGEFLPPERIVLKMNGVELSPGNPLIAPDESFLIFVITTDAGLGGPDLYISFQQDGNWSNAQNLGRSVNSEYADFAPCLSPDGAYLFFTSERPGVVPEGVVDGRPPGDIWQVDFDPQKYNLNNR